ncbi:MAG TPA: cytochrome C, partial [Candidatus Binatia bacterium]|nr:cytochrome C [Candidatus Binatia bacterium]
MRNFLRHPLSLIGAGLVILSGVSILFLFLIEAISGRSNPYLGIFTYMIYPALLVVGLILVPAGLFLERRRRVRGGETSRYPVIDLNSGRIRGVFLFVVVASIFLMGL